MESFYSTVLYCITRIEKLRVYFATLGRTITRSHLPEIRDFAGQDLGSCGKRRVTGVLGVKWQHRSSDSIQRRQLGITTRSQVTRSIGGDVTTHESTSLLGDVITPSQQVAVIQLDRQGHGCQGMCALALGGKTWGLLLLFFIYVVAIPNLGQTAAADILQDECLACGNLTTGKCSSCIGHASNVVIAESVRRLEYMKAFTAENEWKNRLITWTLPSVVREQLPHWGLTWYRNCMGATLLYLISGGIWCLVVYFLAGKRYYSKEMVPEWSEMKKQIMVNFPFFRSGGSESYVVACRHALANSCLAAVQSVPSLDGCVMLDEEWKALCWLRMSHYMCTTVVACGPGVAMPGMPFYSALPTFAEWMVEQGWSKCYPAISDIGLPAYCAYFVVYMTFVEFGVYWVHRLLHDIKPLYKLLHATHHIYNKQNTLSPFAGLAFNPIDGCLQASPYVIALFLIPMHHFTHTLLLFATGVWTTNIHDCIHGNLWPVMGAGYHTIHHITYKHNYGHYLTVMDWIFGTLRTPPSTLAGKVVTTACAPAKGGEAEVTEVDSNGVSSATRPVTTRARAAQKKAY
eukprot:jgi/Mesvir1/16200/Mv08462-RA.1